MRQMWGLGERKFPEEINWKMRLYEAMLNAILMYRVELKYVDGNIGMDWMH